MNCTKCHSDNPEGITYCGQCGEKLEKICSKCNSVNPPQFKFCGRCGTDLSLAFEHIRKELSPDEKLEKIQKYFPQGIMDKILSQKDKIDGERRHVTVLFADVSGFTPMSETMDPEDVTGIMNECFRMIGECIETHGGIIDKFIGDCVMALFGAPVALEDAPQRAIRSAIMIHREMIQFNEKIRHQKENMKPLRMRIGIHTGPVVAGMVGSDGKQDFTVMGDTVNLASRMESLAEPGTTLVTEDTFRLAEGLFRFEALGKKEIKGKEKPVNVYQVIATSTRRTRFDVSTERGLTPFVGRERELELLLDGYERIKEGRGQAYSIMGEAGVGKSRLLYEFRKAIINEDATFLEGKCLSYGRGAAYHPIIDILKSNFEIREDEEDHKIREKVINGLKTLKVDMTLTLPYLLELLSVKDSGIDKIQLSPEGKKERMIETMRQIVMKGAEIRPLIMAIEDLHWADSSTEDALKYLLESIPGIRMLLIFTYRPEFVHTWGGRSYHNQVTLNRLSNRESLMMAAHLLRTREIGRELEDLILSKSEGIPFFIEEFIKSLKDLRIIECSNGSFQITKDLKTVAIPSTIHDVIMARVDSLPQGAKEILLTGSAIEREFSHDLIKKVTQISEQLLLSHLSILKDSELLYERGIYPHSTYIFKHALTREVVYDSILTKNKKHLHEKIGRAIEDICKDNLDEYYGVLTEHFIASENYERGAEYSRLAHRKAVKAGSYFDATVYVKRWVLCLEKLPQTGDWQQKQIDARTALGLLLTQTNHWLEAREAIDPILEIVTKTNYIKRLGQINSILGSYYGVIEDLPRSFDTLDKALKISKEVKDVVSELWANYWLSVFQCFDCNFEKALVYYQRYLDICEELKYPWAISAIKSSMAIFCYLHQGKFNQQYEISSDSVRLAEEMGDPYLKALAYTSHGRSLYGKGMFEEAEKYLFKAVEFIERFEIITWHALAHVGLAEMYYETKEYQKSGEHYEKAVDLLEHNQQSPSWVRLWKTGLIRSRVMNNEKDVEFDALYAYARNNKIKMTEGYIATYIGEILLNLDGQHMPESEHWIQKGIEASERNGMRFNLAQGHALYTEWYKRKGDRLKAQENLGKTIEIYRECGADGWVIKVEKELAALS